MKLGAVYVEQRNYAEAIPALSRALERDPALVAQGFGAASIPHLEKARMDDLLGVALLETDRPREALDRLEAALLKRPDDPDLLYYLSQAHAALARRAFERLEQSGPDSARAHLMRGEALASAGNREGAEERLSKALGMRPDMRGVHYALGELHLASGDYQKAESEFRAEAKLAPGSAATAFKLGSVLLNRGQLGEARAELERANQLQPAMPETLLELGKAMAATGDPESAVKYLEQLLQAEQTTKVAAAAHFQLAQAYRKLGRKAEADRELKLFNELRSLPK